MRSGATPTFETDTTCWIYDADALQASIKKPLIHLGVSVE